MSGLVDGLVALLNRLPRVPRSTAVGWALVATAGLLVALAGTLVVAASYYSLPAPGTSTPRIRLYAAGRPLAVAYPGHRAQDWVPLAEIPRQVVDAVVTAEDRRFWR